MHDHFKESELCAVICDPGSCSTGGLAAQLRSHQPRAKSLESEPNEGSLRYQPPTWLWFCQQHQGMRLEKEATAVLPMFAFALEKDADMEARGFSDFICEQ